MEIRKHNHHMRAFVFVVLSATAVQASSSQTQTIARASGEYTLHDAESFERFEQPREIAFDSGWMGGGSLGLATNPNWTEELSWDYTSNEIDKGSVSQTSAPTVKIEGGDYSYDSVFLSDVFIPEALGLQSLRPYVDSGEGLIQESDVDLIEGGVETSYNTGGEVATQWMVALRQGLDSQTALQLELRGVRAKNLTLNEEAGTESIVDLEYNPLDFNAGIVYDF